MGLLRIALVEDNNDPKKLGRIKARIYPEFESLEDSSLPWVNPSFINDTCIPDKRIGVFRIPENKSFVLVEIDPTWQEFTYRGLTPRRDREGIHEDLSKKLSDKTGASFSYPQPLLLRGTKDEVIAYHNTDSGELGIVSKEGVYISFNSKGDFVIGKKGKNTITFSSDGKLIFNNKSGDSPLTLFGPLKEVLEKLLTHNHVAPNGPTTPAQESNGTPLSTLKSKLQEMETK